jgi:hypothetical protein
MSAVDAAATVRMPLDDALRYWEPRRIIYNLLLIAVVLRAFARTWPESQREITFANMLALLVLAVLANLCYATAYLVDLPMQYSSYAPLWRRVRPVLWIAGTVFAWLLATYWMGDEALTKENTMFTDYNFIPPLAVLGLLGAIFGSVFAAAAIAIAAALHKRQFVRGIGLAWLAGAGVYTVLLLACSLSSHERVLGRGQEKYFCEVDCHTAYSVAAVRTVTAIGGQRANGAFYVLALRTRFDENTISPARGRELPLIPNSRRLELVVPDGRRFGPAAVDPATLEALMGARSKPLREALRPGESYETLVAFDVPADAAHPRLLLSSGDWETRLLIGQENSFLHRKTYMEL